jgi:8-oxo-dGTP pyrophosphatase MutT (NUDIX family)
MAAPEFSAGGVVIRRFRGRPFAAVVRIKRRGVFALPKGHPDGDETPEQAATREVREETGVNADIVEKLGDVRYWYTREGRRRPKIVSFYLFRYRSGSLADHDNEVEYARWVPLEELPEVLAYQGEQDMARAAQSRYSGGG